MKKYNLLIFIVLYMVLSPKLYAQINDGERHFVLVKGQTLVDTIGSNFSVTILTQNCSAQPVQNLAGKNKKVIINPPQSNPNYVGKAKAWAQYTDGFKPRYITWHITYVNSKINTQEDFVGYSNDTPITVLPLSNDISSHSGLQLTGIAQTTGGTSSFTGDSITFTPSTNADMGFILYSVKNDEGATANGKISFYKLQSNYSLTDTLHYKLLNHQNQVLRLPSNDFSLVDFPSKGSLVAQNNFVFKYTPNPGQTGIDQFRFTNSNGGSRVIVIDLINRVNNTSSVRDDYFYTPKNTPITFNVFANDLASHFPISNVSAGLVRDTLGIMTYTPPTGFSGVKNFTYTVNYGTWQATGKIVIHIGNYQPLNTENYTFKTLKNDPLVLTYDVPVDGYQFNILNQPQFGTVEVFSNTNVSEGCNTFYSKSTLIYTPDQQYYGGDSFDIEYCVVNNPCVVYKIYLDIVDGEVDTLCHCNGNDCVWAGDMNGDGRVSVTDILSLGRYLGLSGPARSDINYTFRSGQNADNWGYDQPNGLNIKHIDANGDGLISDADTLAIHNYYANISQLVPEETLAIKDYAFNLIPNATEVDSGDLLIIDISIGSNANPVKDLFGLAFGLNLNPAVIDSSSLNIEYLKNSWFAQGSGTLEMTKQPKDGVVHTAFTKTNAIVEDEIDGFKPTGETGFGSIGQISFIVEDEIDGFKSSDTHKITRINASGIQIEDVNGSKYSLPDTYIDIRLNTKKSEPVPSEAKLIVYPNPVNQDLTIHFNGRNIIKSLMITDQLGNIIDQIPQLDQQSWSVNTANYPEGIYFVKVVSIQGVITKKIVVLHTK
jgi:hypothetical protein